MTNNYCNDSTDALLSNRGMTHGDFRDHARITQQLKDVISLELDRREHRGQTPLHPTAREAIDMILHKIGRIVAGKWDFVDHWDDLAGYPRLVANQIREGSERPTPPLMDMGVNQIRGGPMDIGKLRICQPNGPYQVGSLSDNNPVKVSWDHDDPGDETPRT